MDWLLSNYKGLNRSVVPLLCLAVTGCATIMHGTTQGVGLSSSPSGATVTIDNQSYGKTPTIAELKRKDTHFLRIEMEGFEPFEATLTRSVSGWVWGNIVIGGLVGLAVDAISGGLYKLSPEQLHATLSEQRVSLLLEEDEIFVTMVPEADPNWQRIGSLEPNMRN